MSRPDEPPQVMWQGRYITAMREGRWEYVNRAAGIGAAVIIAIDEAAEGQHVLLVEQYRVPLHRNCIELPAGLIGDEGGEESAIDAAARELEEETGYRAADWSELGTFYSSPGMVGECFTLMLARGLTRVGPGGGVAGENIVVHRVPVAGVAAFVAAKREEGCGVDVKVTMLLVGGWLG